MKQLRLSVFAVVAIVIALATTTYGFASTPETIPDENKLHWFRASDGEYLGFELKSVMEVSVCAGTGNECANGYSQITGDPGEEVPVLPSFVEGILKI